MTLRAPQYTRFFAATLIICLRAFSQTSEPILTWNAVPNPLGTASLKLDFVSPLGDTGGSSTQALPVTRLELGLGHGLEMVFQLPLLRASEPDGTSVFAAGQFSVATRYLFVGSQTSRFAMSIAGRLEVPSGDSALVGDAFQLMAMLLSDWRITPELTFHSNLAWNTTVGSTNAKFANFQHSHAVVWSVKPFFAPVFEVAGSTSTLTGNSELVVQPEVIIAPRKSIELKTGLSVPLIPTVHVGIRAQLALFFGKGN